MTVYSPITEMEGPGLVWAEAENDLCCDILRGLMQVFLPGEWHTTLTLAVEYNSWRETTTRRVTLRMGELTFRIFPDHSYAAFQAGQHIIKKMHPLFPRFLNHAVKPGSYRIMPRTGFLMPARKINSDASPSHHRIIRDLDMLHDLAGKAGPEACFLLSLLEKASKDFHRKTGA